MRSRWEALRSGIVRSIEGSDAARAFGDLRSSSKAFEPYSTPAALVAAVASNPDLGARDPALRALVAAAHDRSTRRLAQALLLLCLWPALDAVFRRRFDLFRSRPQDLVSEIVAGFTIEVNRIDLRRVACLTATLLRNTERNLVRARQRERDVAANSNELTPDLATIAPLEPHVSAFGLPCDQPDTESVVALRGWLQRAIGDEADMVVEAVLNGRNQRELAETLGISHAAARKRLGRALARARLFFLADPGSQAGTALAFPN